MLEDSVSVFSPEGVSLELPIAGPGPRILAYAIDYVLLIALSFLLLLLLFSLIPAVGWVSDLLETASDGLAESVEDPERAVLALLPIFVALMIFLTMGELIYFTFFEFVTGGRSPGKLVLGLRVTSDSGLPLDFGSSLTRNILRTVDVLPSSYALGLTAMMLSERWQRLGDMAAGTLVIRTDRLDPEADLSGGDSVPPLRLSRDQLGRIGANELALLRGTLRRLEQVHDERAEKLVREAVAALRQRLELEQEPDEEGVRFLRRLLATATADSRRR